MLPTILAVSLIFADDSEYTPDTLSITLYDSEHVLIAEETASPNDAKHNSLVDIFYHMITASSPTDKAPFPKEECSPMYASVVYNGNRSEYTCYFSLTSNSSYYIDSSGKIFLIGTDTAMDFLLSQYAESLYSKAAPPKLYTNMGLTVIPSSASWFYRLQNDNYREAMNYETTKEALSYEFSSILDLSFEDDPDDCIVRVFENGTLIYEGTQQGLSSLTVETDSALRISVTAKWKELDGVLFHGDVSYSFNAILRDRSEFFLNGDTLTKGGFLTLSCTNISDISQITFKSDMDSAPTFSFHGDDAVALIPYPKDPATDIFDFTVTYGASVGYFSVKLKSVERDTSYTLSSSSQKALDAMSDQALSEFTSIIKDTSSRAGKTVYFRGNFSSPLEQGFSAGYAYGSTVISSGGEKTLTAFGNEYLSSSNGQSVKVLCSGKVIATGHCSSIGNYVAVDHGLGLISWYCHLSMLDTCEGKTLALNDSVGKAGDGGFADGNGVLILVTLNGEFLDPSFLIK